MLQKNKFDFRCVVVKIKEDGLLNYLPYKATLIFVQMSLFSISSEESFSKNLTQGRNAEEVTCGLECWDFWVKIQQGTIEYRLAKQIKLFSQIQSFSTSFFTVRNKV